MLAAQALGCFTSVVVRSTAFAGLSSRLTSLISPASRFPCAWRCCVEGSCAEEVAYSYRLIESHNVLRQLIVIEYYLLCLYAVAGISLRRSELSDVPLIAELIQPQTAEIFGDVNLVTIM